MALASGAARALRPALRAVSLAWLSPMVPIAWQRRGADLATGLLPLPSDVKVSTTSVGGVPAEWIAPRQADPASVLLYLHGGGYAIGSARSHRPLAAALAEQIGVHAAVLDYPLAPEHPHPAALDDALAAYRELLRAGYAAERIAVTGDSAGGGLALALAMRIRDEDIPPPAVVGMICPWLDLTLDLTGTRTPAPDEPLLRRSTLSRWAAAYKPDGAADPAVSPLHGEFSGLPPLVMHSAGDDLLAEDADRFEQLAREVGISIEHRRYPGLWHDFHSMTRVLPAADDAIAELGGSLRAKLAAPSPAPRVGIVGAGMSGLCMAAKLQRAGIENFTIYEKASEVGGTWRENTYPGLSCDVPSRFYSYSFAPNPDWRHTFPPGEELQAYFVRCADDLGLRQHIRFDSDVTEARWKNGRWRLRTADGHTDAVDILVAATGVLHHPKVPDIKGLDSFAGPCFHSARWDHTVPLEGKRIALIGTGSTGVQITTALSRVAGKLQVFQRTPQWVLPLPSFRYSPVSRALMRRFPKLNRISYLAYQRVLEATFAHAVTEPGWRRTAVSALCRASLRFGVRDPELRHKLTPKDEPMCKRLIMSGGYHRAVQRSSVDVVTDGIDHVEPQGIVTVDGKLHEADVLVLATGFDAHAFVRPMRVVGENGVSIDEAWQDGPRAYHTVAVPGFPNYFMLIGPHSPIGNHSLIAIAEAQADYVLQWIEELRRGEIRSIAPTREATEAFNAEMRMAMPNTVWTTGCNSWYLGADGLPELWPWTPSRHREMLRRPVQQDFVIRKKPNRARSVKSSST